MKRIALAATVYGLWCLADNVQIIPAWIQWMTVLAFLTLLLVGIYKLAIWLLNNL